MKSYINMKEIIRKLGEHINNYPHTKTQENIYYTLCKIVYRK